MAKQFNITGTCIPGRHYMVDTSLKIKKVIPKIKNGEYFALNFPRQFGKTTTLFLLEKELEQHGFLPVSLSFEGIGDLVFENEEIFCKTFVELLAEALKWKDETLSSILMERSRSQTSFKSLSNFITDFTRTHDSQLVLFIDEVDKSSNNQLFLSFIGMLRDKYLKRNEGKDFSFQSIILAGVHDIKSMKLKIRDDKSGKYNSPWNIAMAFPADLGFSPDEIDTMLEDYSEDMKIKIDVREVSRRLHYQKEATSFGGGPSLPIFS